MQHFTLSGPNIILLFSPRGFYWVEHVLGSRAVSALSLASHIFCIVSVCEIVTSEEIILSPMCRYFTVAISHREKNWSYTPICVCFISRKGCNIVLQTRRIRDLTATFAIRGIRRMKATKQRQQLRGWLPMQNNQQLVFHVQCLMNLRVNDF